MRWKGRVSKDAVLGVNEVEIPQFTIANYEVESVIVDSMTGEWTAVTFMKTHDRCHIHDNPCMTDVKSMTTHA